MTDQEHSTEKTPQLVMYCRRWCGDCARARAWLDAHSIDYVEIDVDADDGARDHAAGLNDGRLHTPTFTLGEGVCVDFRPEKLKDLLGI